MKQIGEYVYGQYKSGKELSDEPAALCAEIDGHNAVIEETKAEIERIKAEDAASAAVICPDCCKENAPGTNFCQDCGAKLEAAGKRLCACGADVPSGSRFCGECGAKFD